jgi:hypothetical protein
MRDHWESGKRTSERRRMDAKHGHCGFEILAGSYTFGGVTTFICENDTPQPQKGTDDEATKPTMWGFRGSDWRTGKVSCRVVINKTSCGARAVVTVRFPFRQSKSSPTSKSNRIDHGVRFCSPSYVSARRPSFLNGAMTPPTTNSH